VLDTNVVLDCLHFADPAALPILHALQAGRIEWRTTPAMLEELQRVLAYPALGLAPARQADVCARYRRLAGCVEAPAELSLPRCRDADDQKFLELAAAEGAAVLVSKDRALLGLKGRRRLGFRILAPAQASVELAAGDAMLAVPPAGARR
jgi:putative PIN family toxin of toxin-antitoxin system